VKQQANATKQAVGGAVEEGGGDGDGHGEGDGGSVGAGLLAELWGCRVLCRDMAWAPVCHNGGTFANECWVHCSTSVFLSNNHDHHDEEDHVEEENHNPAVFAFSNSSSSSSFPSSSLSSPTQVKAQGGRGNHSGANAQTNTNTVNVTALGGRGSTANTTGTSAPAAATTVPGVCDPAKDRFRHNDHDYSCHQKCVTAWPNGEGVRGGGQFARWRPACGEDGVTYTTACFAACSGVRSAEGECHDITPLTLRRRTR